MILSGRSRHLGLLALIVATSGTAAAQWNGTNTLWTEKNVGIGTPAPGYQLHVVENEKLVAVYSESSKSLGTGVFGVALGKAGSGVVGMADSPGNSVGVKGIATSGTGRAVWGYAGDKWGENYAIYGQTSSYAGYSGYFTGGKFYYGGGPSGFMGVGRTWQVNSTEAFGVYRHTDGWGGMYMSTNGGGEPYYGYATGGVAKAFHYYDSSSYQWKLWCGGDRISVNAGNARVGINTNAPGYTLHVNGNAGKPGGGSWSNASDRRLKKDVEPLADALERLLSVRGVSYEYIDPAALHELPGRQIGVVAQEVEAAFPQWVDEDENGYKRVTFRGFEGVTIEALRELDEENGALREALTSLHGKNERLAAELAGMNERLATLEASLTSAANGRR